MNFKKELKPTIILAIPVVITQLGQMMMGVVDTFMVGKLGPEAIGATALGNAIFFAATVFAMGLISPLDHYVSHALGLKHENEAVEWRLQGFYNSILISAPLMILVYLITKNLSHFGIPEVTVLGTQKFMELYNLSLIPMMIYFALRQYLQAKGSATAVTVSMIIANIINAFFNWLFVYGNLGAPAMGVRGSAMASLITRSFLAIGLLVLAFYKHKQTNWKIKFNYQKKILKMGFPAGLHYLFEVGVFSLSTALVSRLGPIMLAAHSITLTIAASTFMIPLGISAAAAIRVSKFMGENKKREMIQAGDAAFLLALIVMVLSAMVMLLWGKFLIGLFTKDIDVIAIGSKVILLAALFQVADGIQVVAGGALRGLGETKITAIANFVGHWIIGLPVGYYLCFHKNYAALGLWTGLSLGLFFVALSLFIAWRRKDRLISASI